jgi:hypothetical protein
MLNQPQPAFSDLSLCRVQSVMLSRLQFGEAKWKVEKRSGAAQKVGGRFVMLERDREKRALGLPDSGGTSLYLFLNICFSLKAFGRRCQLGSRTSSRRRVRSPVLRHDEKQIRCRHKGPRGQYQCIMRERSVGAMCGSVRTEGSSRKVGERGARYLEGKIPVDANDLSLKEATA